MEASLGVETEGGPMHGVAEAGKLTVSGRWESLSSRRWALLFCSGVSAQESVYDSISADRAMRRA